MINSEQGKVSWCGFEALWRRGEEKGDGGSARNLSKERTRSYGGGELKVKEM